MEGRITMSDQELNRSQYDIVSLTRAGQDKRANFIQKADHISRNQKPQGSSFVRVFADIWLSQTAGKKSFF